MSAIDTLDWFIGTAMKNTDEETRKLFRGQRSYFQTLRSEDEKQRFVDEFIKEFYERTDPDRKKAK